MIKTYTNEEVMQMLRDAAGWKGAGALAEKAGMSKANLSEVMSGRLPPNTKALAVLGLRWAIIEDGENNSCKSRSQGA